MALRRAGRAASSLAVLSPRDGRPFAQIEDMAPAAVDHAVSAAARCFESGWSRPAAVHERASVLRSMASELRARKTELAELESLDCGRPINETRSDLTFASEVLEYYAEVAPRAFVKQSIALPDPQFSSHSVAEPAGVVACVTPWNYPLVQAIAKVGPALATGCSVLLKPSPLASLTCIELGKLGLRNGLPSGALSIITGGPPSGRASGAQRLVEHPRVDRLSFTGSGRAGQELLHASAERLRPSSLELGGKGALIVFDDADVNSAVDWAMAGIFSASGQICSATSRLLVHQGIARKMTDALLDAASTIRIGDPLLDSTQMGALISAAQQASVLNAINGALEDGASLLLGSGKPHLVAGLDGGFYVAPTVLSSIPRSSFAWKNEIFGPVLALASFDSEDDAIAMANDSTFGLGHAVMSADQERCERVAARLQAGIVWINCNQNLWPATPFGGWKQSGFGKEYGEAGLHEYLRHKTVIRAPHGYTGHNFS